MTSYYARNHRLSQRTLDAYSRSNVGLHDRLVFYYHYLQDVVPHGVTVHHMPGMPSGQYGTRQEIELRTYTGSIFMYGLVSMENHTNDIEMVAGNEAYGQHLDGEFVRDSGTWRFFTGLSQLRVYCCFGSAEWELMGVMHLIRDVREVAAYLQRQYDSLRHH